MHRFFKRKVSAAAALLTGVALAVVAGSAAAATAVAPLIARVDIEARVSSRRVR